MKPDFILRPAQPEDIPRLNTLVRESADKLSRGFYTGTQIQSLNEYVFSVDSEIVSDKTYYLIEINNKFAACGGWSRRKNLFGGDQAATRIPGFLDPTKDAAKIRAFFIYPDYERKGLGSKLMRHCEQEASKAGFSALELMSTMPGVPFYERHGFMPMNDAHHNLAMPDGVSADFLPMRKGLPAKLEGV